MSYLLILDAHVEILEQRCYEVFLKLQQSCLNITGCSKEGQFPNDFSFHVPVFNNQQSANDQLPKWPFDAPGNVGF